MIILSFYLSISLNSKRVIFIPKGSTNSIITYLNKNNYDLNIVDKAVINFFGYPQNGWIDLKTTHMTKFEFLYKLTKLKAAVKSVILIPGETYYFFLKQVSQKLKVPHDELLKSYKKYAFKLDGNILAQTYFLPYGMKSDDIVKYLINYSNNEYKKYSLKIFGTYNKEDWYKYLSMASVIQKESASKEEMPIVSSVIYNRINKKMKLQMDGTLNYGKYSHTKITPKRIKEDTSGYNTYKINSIPLNPVCAVGFDAIKSAIFPKKTDYLYFMKSVEGNSHIFSTNYNSHKKVIDDVKKSKRFTDYLKNKKSKNKLHKKSKNQKNISTNQLWQSVK